MIRTAIVAVALCASFSAAADTKCGSFLLSSGYEDGFFRVNGTKPETQKVTFLKQQEDYENVMVQWMVPRSDAPGWLGMDYIKRNGKAILNVEVTRSNMDQPRVFGSFDCVRVK